MPCQDCLENCADSITSDKCVKLTVDIPCLGLCAGDTLYEFEVAVVEKLCAALDGTGIDLSDVTISCQFLLDILGSNDKNLKELIQMLIAASCTLRELIQNLDDEIHTPYSFNTTCLSGLPTTPTRDDILNAGLIKLCSVATDVAAIKADYVKESELCTKVAQCLSSGGGGTTQEYTKMPKYVALPYHGSLSVFDANGVGLSAFGYDKVYICNGQVVGSFTTPDYRGRSPIGVNLGLPGGTLDSAVNPGLPANAAYGISINTKKGGYVDTLTLDQVPAHTHPLNDPGHHHNLNPYVSDASQGSSNQSLKGDTSDNAVNYINTSVETTGITVGSAGNSQPHNSTHPVIGAVFVMYIP